MKGKNATEELSTMRSPLPLNALVVLTNGSLRRGEKHHGGTPFTHPDNGIQEQGADILDRIAEPAKDLGIDVYLGATEDKWGYDPDYPGYTTIAMLDCFGRINRLSCVNNPVWRDFQIASIEDAVREHPWLRGIMFMHERVGPLHAVFLPSDWQAGGRNPVCFCDHCRRKGRALGYDPERAKIGYQELLKLFEPDIQRPCDGWFVHFWRLISKYPEIMAWERLQWDSLHDFRARIAGAARVAHPGISVGYHFQNATSTTDFLWRAGDDPSRITQYADWVKPSVYPGVSGFRGRGIIDRLGSSLFGDIASETVAEVITSIMGHSPETRQTLQNTKSGEEKGLPAVWLTDEIHRLAKACAPKPVYAGLGLGVPNGTTTETPETMREWTEACFAGGAKGILLSRHYSEMKPELVRVVGDVIRGHLGAPAADH